MRLFHWTVVAGCAINLIVEEGNTFHRAVGYVVAAAVAVRVVWGFVGNGHARFSDFIPTPAALLGYLRQLVSRNEPRYIGHNPAGSVMIFLLLGSLIAVSITGWMMGLDRFFGNETLEELHETFAMTILVSPASTSLPPSSRACVIARISSSPCLQEESANRRVRMSIMRLILIEDNHRLAESIRLGLEAEGFAVDRFDTLASARSALDGVPYDLILLDLGMPDGDGVALIASLRRSKVTTPILIITARDGIGDRVRGLDSGADDYLVKPFARRSWRRAVGRSCVVRGPASESSWRRERCRSIQSPARCGFKARTSTCRRGKWRFSNFLCAIAAEWSPRPPSMRPCMPCMPK